MKKYITKNLLIHAFVLAISSFLFRVFISWALSNEYFTGVWFIAALYCLSVYLLIWKFSVLDKKILPIYDLGFRFHLVTYIVWVVISYLWFSFGNISSHENMNQVHISSLYWLLTLIVHFCIYLFSRRKTIKGLKKTEIFD